MSGNFKPMAPPSFFGPANKVSLDKPHGTYPEHFDTIHKIGDQGAIKTRVNRSTLETISIDFVPSNRLLKSER